MSYNRQEQLKEVHVNRKAATEKKANAAIDILLKEKTAINFNTVSKMSGVTVATLYRHDAIRKRIMLLRDSIRELPKPADKKNNMSDVSKDAIIASLKRKIKRLEDENKELREVCDSKLSEDWKKL